MGERLGFDGSLGTPHGLCSRVRCGRPHRRLTARNRVRQLLVESDRLVLERLSLGGMCSEDTSGGRLDEDCLTRCRCSSSSLRSSSSRLRSSSSLRRRLLVRRSHRSLRLRSRRLDRRRRLHSCRVRLDRRGLCSGVGSVGGGGGGRGGVRGGPERPLRHLNLIVSLTQPRAQQRHLHRRDRAAFFCVRVQLDEPLRMSVLLLGAEVDEVLLLAQ